MNVLSLPTRGILAEKFFTDLIGEGLPYDPEPSKSDGYVLFLGVLFLCYANLKRDRDTELDLKTNNWHCPLSLK